jgi:GAF domain-containing protein
MQGWTRGVLRSLASVPRPGDDPRVHASGVESDRLLLFGGGAAVGWGVLSHDLGLPGSLARKLSTLTRRGTDIDVRASPEFRASTAIRDLARVDLARYDGIILTLGLSELLSLDSARSWRQHLDELLDHISEQSSSQAQIFVVGVQALTQITAYDRFMAPLMSYHRAAINRASALATAHRVGVTFIPFDPPPGRDGNRHRTHNQYLEFAAILAPPIAAALDRVFEQSHAPRQRFVPLDEDARRFALERLHILDSAPEERLNRLVEFARRAFHTASAAITIIDDDRFWLKAGAGTGVSEGRRESAICVTTMGQSGALVVSDVSVDARFADRPHAGTSPTRFYAGFPIEAPNGVAIGALCVFDPAPREVRTFDHALLRDIALMVQKEFWLRSARDSQH